MTFGGTPAALNLAELERVAGNIDAARARYEKILERNPKHEQAMLRLANIAFAEEKNDAAIDWLNKAVTANPKSHRPRIRLVNALLLTRQHKQALNAARELAQIAEKDPDALDSLARAQIATGNLANGISTYRQLTQIVPSSATGHHRLGRTLAANKSYAEAADALDRAIALDKNLIAARRDRIRVAYLVDGAGAALALAREMTEEAPDQIHGYLLQGDVHMQAGAYDAASAMYAEAQKRSPTSQTLTRHYRSLARAGKVDAARGLLEDWLARHPDDTSIRFVYASDLVRAKKIPDAIRENEILLKRFPNNAVLLNDLAWLYGEAKDGRAVAFAQRAHDIAPDSPAIADTLGWLLVKKGDTEKGLDLLQKAHAGAPDQHDIAYHLAAALSQAGQDDKALKLLKDILDTGEKFDSIEEARKLYAALATK